MNEFARTATSALKNSTPEVEALHAARATARFEALTDATEETNQALSNAVKALRAEVTAMMATVPNAPLSAREVGAYSSRAMKLAYALETALLRRTSTEYGNTRTMIESQEAS